MEQQATFPVVPVSDYSKSLSQRHKLKKKLLIQMCVYEVKGSL